MRVRTHDDLVRWLKFFLVGVVETSEQAINGLKRILELKKDCEERRIYKLNKKINMAKILLDYLFHQPVIDVDNVTEQTGLSKVSAYGLIDDFVKLKSCTRQQALKETGCLFLTNTFKIFSE